MNRKIIATGIDVSYANGKIDWSKVKGTADFAILRCGFGGDYKNQDDVQFFNNVKGCQENAIPFGVYLYSYATSVEKAKSEAEHTLRLIKGLNFKLPVFLDLEEPRISALGKTRVLEIAKTFCEIIEKAGYTYGTYANKNWFANYLTDPWYDTKIKWLAQYNDTVTYEGSYDIWQYTSSGVIDGLGGRFDFNRSYILFDKGDVNADGEITAADARLILRAAAKLENLDEEQKKEADVNDDGKITAADAREVLRKSSGLE